MHWRNFILENIILPVGDRFTGGVYMQEIRRWRKLMHSTPDAIENIQKQKLNKLLDHAIAESKYYGGLEVSNDDDPVSRLQSFPILTKQKLREKGDEILTTSKNDLIEVRSSGSSGFQLNTYRNSRELSIIRAIQTVFWEQEGFRMGSPVIQTGINPNRTFEKRLKDFLFDTNYLAAFSMSHEDAKDALRWIRKKGRGVVVVGYASSLNVMSEYFLEFGELPEKGSVKSVISLGDKLFDHYRDNIKKAFGVTPYETYGASEGLMMGFQVDNPFLYIPEPHVFLEILDDNGNPVKDGEMGHVTVTSLDNYSMPLIRYQLGDLAMILPKEEYPSVRDLPFKMIKKVIGRDTDIVVLPSGNKMVVHSFTGIFEHHPEILQFCVIQDDTSGIVIEYIPSDRFFPEILENLRHEITQKANEDFGIEFKQVGEIAPTASGKPQIIISRLKK